MKGPIFSLTVSLWHQILSLLFLYNTTPYFILPSLIETKALFLDGRFRRARIAYTSLLNDAAMPITTPIELELEPDKPTLVTTASNAMYEGRNYDQYNYNYDENNRFTPDTDEQNVLAGDSAKKRWRLSNYGHGGAMVRIKRFNYMRNTVMSHFAKMAKIYQG